MSTTINGRRVELYKWPGGYALFIDTKIVDVSPDLNYLMELAVERLM